MRVPWEQIRPDSSFVKRAKNAAKAPGTQRIRIDLKDAPVGKEFLDKEDVDTRPVKESFDPVYAVRAIADLIPNPWQGRAIVAETVRLLEACGLDQESMGVRESNIIFGVVRVLVVGMSV